MKEKLMGKISLEFIKKVLYFIVLILLVFLIINKFSKTRVLFSASANKIKTKEIEQLNLAKFTWNGIAEYTPENKKNDKTYIKYEANIVATMNFENFEDNISINHFTKVITVTLPKVQLQPNVIFKDGGKSFSFIPKNTDIEMKELVKVCEDDALEKVKKKTDMIEIAKENAKNTIEGLFLPMIEEEHYDIIWKDGE